jgi:hypothetical protein
MAICVLENGVDGSCTISNVLCQFYKVDIQKPGMYNLNRRKYANSKREFI